MCMCVRATHIQMGTKDKNDLINAHLKKILSSEETAILDEVRNSDYFQEKQRRIKGCCTNLCANDDVYSRGAHNPTYPSTMESRTLHLSSRSMQGYN